MPWIPISEPHRPWKQKRKAHGRRKNYNQAFFNSKAWRLTSKRNLANNPLCASCHKKGLIVGADLTDHIIPINDGGSQMDSENHQSLCHPCHNRKSGKEAHKTGIKGKD